MPWIRFTPDEPPAPSRRTPTAAGGSLDPADYRGRGALALAFLPGDECWPLGEHLAQAVDEFLALEAEVLLVSSNELASTAAAAEPGVHLLLDRDEKLRRDYENIFEFDVRGQGLLFILNNHGAPFRAWVGPCDDPAMRVDEALRFLESAALLCPE